MGGGYFEDKTMPEEKVGNDGITSSSDESYRTRKRTTRSGKAVLKMRKNVSITSVDKSKSKTSQQDLATAVVAGDLIRTEQILDAYVALYRADGFKTILEYKYNLDPKTLVITCIETPTLLNNSPSPGIVVGEQGVASVSGGVDVGVGVEERELEEEHVENIYSNFSPKMFNGLSILHLSCAFDQEPVREKCSTVSFSIPILTPFQILLYFIRYGISVLKSVSQSGQTLLHTCCWFGTSGTLAIVARYGYNICAKNSLDQQPIHLSVLRGHLSCLRIMVFIICWDFKQFYEGGDMT